jgi:hypothetical protein
MKIQELPNKDKLTHFNVQYYHNECGQGSATHVVQVTYSTNDNPIKARQKHHQHVVKFNLKTENKAINRLVKDHLGEDAKEEVKATIKQLKKEAGISAFFGFRRVQYALPHKFVAGQVFHKNTIDPKTYVYWFVLPDSTSVMRFTWAGHLIDVPMTEQVNPVENQSLMYAYWTPSVTEDDLTQRIEELKRGKAGHAPDDSEVENTSENASVEEATSDEPVNETCGADAVAGVDGHSEAGRVGNDNQARAAKRKPDRIGKPVQHPGEFSDYGNIGFENGFGMVDQSSESPFFDKYVERNTDLGTSICLRNSL